jgi:GNAT superfamily N-acetyltransferase/RimJ/RimL family protein N-acetyltransferase
VSQIDVREIDPADESLLHDWWQSGHDAMADRPYDLNPTWETSRRILPRPHDDFQQTLLAAYDGAELVGSAQTMLPIADNLTMCYAEVTVPPPHRGRGVGSALLASVEERALAAGRSYVLVEVIARPGQVSAGEKFAASHGYPVANREGIKVLDLREHPDWSALEQRASDRTNDYTIVEWGGTTPEEHQQAVCDALNVFVGMVPSGDLAIEDIALTPERLTRNEKRSNELGRRRFCAGAFAADGSLAGYTDLFLPAHVDTYAQIGITMVLPEHRGHSLGLAMKLATHATLAAEVPTCGLVTTSNADVNDHMNAVNKAMGYRLVEQLLEVQKKL